MPAGPFGRQRSGWVALTAGRGAGVSGPGNVSAAFAGGLGYCFILVIMATLRQRLELAPIPRSLRGGVPILLITAGLLGGIALLGFRF